MTALADRQAEFLRAIFEEGAPRSPGVAIYRRNVLANLHDALAAAYPVVLRLVGAAFFREAAVRFARAVPSRSGDLHAFGDTFPEFLAAYPHARTLPWLADVARLEWAVHEATFAADDGVLDASALAGVPATRAAGVRLRLHAAARLCRSPFPIRSVWEANQPGRDGTPAHTEGAEAVIVTRSRDGVAVTGLRSAEWRFVEAVAAGCSLGEAADAMGEDVARLPALLPRLVGLAAFASFELPPAP